MLRYYPVLDVILDLYRRKLSGDLRLFSRTSDQNHRHKLSPLGAFGKAATLGRQALEFEEIDRREMRLWLVFLHSDHLNPRKESESRIVL
jgi:hypothetical protein